MRELKPGDIVARKSYGGDVFFRVVEIVQNGPGERLAVLKGLELRLVADAPLDDLEIKDAAEILRYRHRAIEVNAACMRRIYRRREVERTDSMVKHRDTAVGEPAGDFFEVPGRVVHLDGDPEYLEKCLHAYAQLDVEVYGFRVSEAEQPRVVVKYLREYTPDILVLTGHDGLLRKDPDYAKLESYRNSAYYVQAVKAARQVEPSRDELVIFAGACQSHYEALLDAGANFASSPQRVLIHAFDPVYVVEKIAFTSINDTLRMQDVIANTITGIEGVGGIETRGRFRLGYPKSPY